MYSVPGIKAVGVETVAAWFGCVAGSINVALQHNRVVKDENGVARHHTHRLTPVPPLLTAGDWFGDDAQVLTDEVRRRTLGAQQMHRLLGAAWLLSVSAVTSWCGCTYGGGGGGGCCRTRTGRLSSLA